MVRTWNRPTDITASRQVGTRNALQEETGHSASCQNEKNEGTQVNITEILGIKFRDLVVVEMRLRGVAKSAGWHRVAAA